jgi:predicted transcriptional regulator
MPSIRTQRVTLSLPSDVVSNLDFLASSMGVSRSALASALMSDILPPLIPLVQIASQGSSEGDSRRYRGEFVTELNAMLGRLTEGVEGLQDDLFNK